MSGDIFRQIQAGHELVLLRCRPTIEGADLALPEPRFSQPDQPLDSVGGEV